MLLESLGNVSNALGNFPKARDYLNQALTIHREIGNRSSEASALASLGEVLSLVGKPDSARLTVSRSLKIYRETGDKFFEGIMLLQISELLYDRTRINEALDTLREARSILAGIGDTQNVLLTDTWIGLATARTGHLGFDRHQLASLDSSFGSVQKGATFLKFAWNLYELNTLLGQNEKARYYLQQAQIELDKRAQKLADESVRKAYLTNVPLNRNIVNAWQRINSRRVH